MIKSIEFTDLNCVPGVPWAKDVALFQREKRFEFAESGLTILWGANGVGKSAILSTLASFFHAKQGGESRVTDMSQYAFDDACRKLPPGATQLGVQVEHDGLPLLYCAAGHTPGLQSGGFDEFMDGRTLTAVMGGGSKGQLHLHQADRHFRKVDGLDPWVQWNLKSPWWTSPLRRDRPELTLKHFLQPTLPVPEPGQEVRTVLLDEMEASLSWRWQRSAFHYLSTGHSLARGQKLFDTSRFQFITASHSPWALGLPGAHYIDLDGTMPQATEAVIALAERLASQTLAARQETP